MNETERQQVVDEEHLKLLRVGFIVSGVMDVLFAFFPLIYVLFGIFIAASVPAPRPGEPNPALFGIIFVVIGLLVSGFFALQGGLKLFSARAIARREHRTLCYVAAGLSCLSVPWGTVLGVLAFMVLTRETVGAKFDRGPEQLAPPPQRSASSLFEDDAYVRREEPKW